MSLRVPATPAPQRTFSPQPLSSPNSSSGQTELGASLTLCLFGCLALGWSESGWSFGGGLGIAAGISLEVGVVNIGSYGGGHHSGNCSASFGGYGLSVHGDFDGSAGGMSAGYAPGLFAGCSWLNTTYYHYGESPY